MLQVSQKPGTECIGTRGSSRDIVKRPAGLRALEDEEALAAKRACARRQGCQRVAEQLAAPRTSLRRRAL